MNNGDTIKELMDKSTNYLKKKNFRDAKSEVEIMLSHILNMDRLDIYLNLDKKIEGENFEKFSNAIKQRVDKKPVSYIIQNHQFLNLELKVKPGVFIPRPETEILVQKVFEYISTRLTKRFNILDIGTGCGNIPVALAIKSNMVRITAIDKSYEAIELAKENSQLHRVDKKIRFFQFDIFNDDFNKLRKQTRRLDLVISNPPYISESQLPELPDEIRLFEPMEALNGGKDGLDFVKKIVLMANGLLKYDGRLFIEIGDGQADASKAFASKYFNASFAKDLNGIQRVLIAEKKNRNKKAFFDSRHRIVRQGKKGKMPEKHRRTRTQHKKDKR